MQPSCLPDARTPTTYCFPLAEPPELFPPAPPHPLALGAAAFMTKKKSASWMQSRHVTGKVQDLSVGNNEITHRVIGGRARAGRK